MSEEVFSFLENHFIDVDQVKRDLEKEEYLCLKSCLELKLLITLEQRQMEVWEGLARAENCGGTLYSLKLKGEAFYIAPSGGEYEFSCGFGQGKVSKNALLGDVFVKKNINGNDNWAIYLGDWEKEGRKWPGQNHSYEFCSDGIPVSPKYPNSNLRTPLLWLFAFVKGMTEEEAVRFLKNFYGWKSRKDWQGALHGWRQFNDVSSFGYLNNCSLSPFEEGLGLYPITNADGFVEMKLAVFDDAVLPVTSWMKDGLGRRQHLNILPKELWPYGMATLSDSQRKKNAVLVTPSLLHAFDNTKNDIDEGVIYTSWYGGEETLDRVNWDALKRREVFYMIHEFDDVSLLEAYGLALKFLNKVQELSGIKLNFVEYLKNKGDDGAASFKLFKATDFARRANDILEKGEVSYPNNFRPNSLKGIQRKKITARKFLIEPLLLERSITLVYAGTNVGKTWFALTLGSFLSRGGKMFERWSVKKPQRVLLVDAEMDPVSLDERMKIIQRMKTKGRSTSTIHDDKFFYISRKPAKDGVEKLQKDILAFVRRNSIKLMILDNLTAFTRHNDTASAWEDVHQFLTQLKLVGCATVLIHHSSKDGKQQRGTSATTNAVDNVIRLEKVEVDNSSELAMEVHVEKGRDIFGLAREKFKIKFAPSAKPPTCVLLEEPAEDSSKEASEEIVVKKRRKRGEAHDALLKEVIEFLKEGMGVKEIAQKLQITKSRIYQIKTIEEAKQPESSEFLIAYSKMRQLQEERNFKVQKRILSGLKRGVSPRDMAGKEGLSVSKVKQINLIDDLLSLERFSDKNLSNRVYSHKLLKDEFRHAKWGELDIASLRESSSLSEKRIEQILLYVKKIFIPELHDKGYSLEELAKHLALPSEKIEKVYSSAGAKADEKKMRQEALEHLLALFDKGFSVDEVIADGALPEKVIRDAYKKFQRDD